MKISKNALIFCRSTITLLVWTAYLFRSKELFMAVFLLLLFSAILKIRRAPLIYLYSNTIDKLLASKKIKTDEKAMRFAHILGSIFSGICLILVSMDVRFAWDIVLIFAIMKTISAFGNCPGEKIYSCMENGCCDMTRKIRK